MRATVATTMPSDIPFRNYQSEAIGAVLQARKHRHRGLLIVLPTGTGKTVTFAGLARAMGGRTLVLAHRRELLVQALDKVRLVWPDVSVGMVQQSQNATAAQVVAASIGTLHHGEIASSFQIVMPLQISQLFLREKKDHARRFALQRTKGSLKICRQLSPGHRPQPAQPEEELRALLSVVATKDRVMWHHSRYKTCQSFGTLF